MNSLTYLTTTITSEPARNTPYNKNIQQFRPGRNHKATHRNAFFLITFSLKTLLRVKACKVCFQKATKCVCKEVEPFVMEADKGHKLPGTSCPVVWSKLAGTSCRERRVVEINLSGTRR